MKNLRYSAALICSALLAASAFAEEKVGSEFTDPGILGACDLTGYKSEAVTFTPAVAIPDNVAAGVTVGPLILPDDMSLIADVIIDINFAHTWAGDLIATVGYDANCDGTVDVTCVLLCRAGRATCVGGTGFGCSANFGTVSTSTPPPECVPYFFGDGAGAVPCPTSGVIPGSCYQPTGVGSGLLSVFDNLRKGGCWYLNISDNAGADTGKICGWSVHIKNQTVIGVEEQPWGAVKTLYR